MTVLSSQKTALQFWQSRKEYPSFGPKLRRFYELSYLIPSLKNVNSVLDLGCGEGWLVECLLWLTNIEKLYAYDISQKFISKINPKIETKIYDCSNPEPLPKVDATIMGSVIQYLMTDTKVLNLLELIESPILFLRTPCSLGTQEVLIEKYSEELGEQYSSRYLTIQKTIELLSTHFIVEDVYRPYPDDIESKFGSKQFYFKCKRRS